MQYIVFQVMNHWLPSCKRPMHQTLNGGKMKKQITLLAVLAASSIAVAVPTPYPMNKTLLFSLTNPTTSGLIADDKEERKVYVLPPNVADATVKGLHSLSANVGYCREIGDLQSYSRDTLKQVKELNDERLAKRPEVEKLLKQLQEARVAAAEVAADKRLQALVDLDDKIEGYEQRLDELYKTEEACDKTCDQIASDIKTTQVARKQAIKDRRQIAIDNADAVKIYDKKKAIAAAAELNYKEAFSTFDMLKKELILIRNEYSDMYRTFSKLEGGRAAINFESGWDKNIETLRLMNPGFQFEKIQTSGAKLFANNVSVKNLPGDLAVTGFELAGTQKDNYLELPAGFPSSLSGNLNLSLIGACPMIHPQYFDIAAGYGPQEMAYGLTITYEYPAAFKLQATAKYNMYKMYEKINSSGSSGGFFSSRSWTKVEERNFFKDSFSVDWVSQDPANQVTEEVRLETEHEMRKAIMERIASLALPTAPNQGQMLVPVAPPPRGGTVVASSLMQACPGNIYCVAGSLILTSLDAIFGSSSTTASYLQTQNFEATETWSQSKVVMKPWVTTYLPRD